MILEPLASRYPSLYLKPGDGFEAYRKAAGKGIIPENAVFSGFIGSDQDELILEKTPAGEVEVLFLANRKDFERALQLLAYKAEKKEIPKTTGAMTLDGLINWEKINKHKEEFLKENLFGWPAEFKAFTSKPENYRDTIIFLSNGPYSNISADQIGFEESEWNKLSRKIRHYHELTHVICRRLYPNQIHPIWDEIAADTMGLLYAFNEFKPDLLKLFLGVSESGYDKGRLENYVSDDLKNDPNRLNELSIEVNNLINSIDAWLKYQDLSKPFEILKGLEENQNEFLKEFPLIYK